MTVANLSIIKTVLRYTVPGASECLNVFTHRYQGSDVPDSDILDAIEDWATNEWGDIWANLATGGTTLQDAHVTVESLAGEVLQDLGYIALAIAGVTSGEVMPAAVALYLQLNTSTPGVYGRKYVPGIDEGFIDDGIFNSGGLVNAALLLLNYIQGLPVAGGGTMYSGVNSTKAGAFKSFQAGGLFSAIPAYQRRRKEGVGS